MLRACTMMLALYAALFAAYYYWLGPQFDPPWVYVGVGVAALITSGCIGALINARIFYRDWSLLTAARHELPLRDGRWTAVCGEVHPVHEPLSAPFSGEECVMCEYDVASQLRISTSSQNENSKPGSDFAGFLMNPCVVRTKSGDVRLLGFPNLDEFAERTCDSYAAARSAREYLRICKFEDYSGLKLVTVIGAITDAWQDDDGLVRKNLRLGKTQPMDLFPPELQSELDKVPDGLPPPPAAEEDEPDEEIDKDEELEDDDFDDDDELEDDDLGEQSFTARIPLLKEKRVKVGEKVCAIGIYSQARGGLTPGGLGLDKFIKLKRGNLDTTIAKTRGSVFSHIIGALIGLALVHGAAYGVLMANRYHPAAIKDRQRDAFRVVEKNDAPRLEKLISRNLDLEAQESGRTLLHLADDPECVKVLIAAGANVNAISEEGQTPLMIAATRGLTPLVRLLIDAKADLNKVNVHGRTALDYAIRGGHAEVEEMLRKAGGKEAPPVEDRSAGERAARGRPLFDPRRGAGARVASQQSPILSG